MKTNVEQSVHAFSSRYYYHQRNIANYSLLELQKCQTRFGTLSRQFLSFNVFLIWGILVLGSLTAYAQVDIQTLGHEVGITGTLSPVLSFRKTTETFYTLPANKTILDYDDYDKIWIEPTYSDEWWLFSLDEQNEPYKLRTVIDPSSQFNPQVYKYKYVLTAPESTTFFHENGEVVLSFPREPVVRDTTITPPDPRNLPLHARIGFPNAKLISTNGSISSYEGIGYSLEIDGGTGAVNAIYYNSMGDIEERVTLFYDFSNPDRLLPEYQVSIFSETLRSGECVFRNKVTFYSDYRDLTQEALQPGEFENTMLESKSVNVNVWPNPVRNTIYFNAPDSNENKVTVWLMSLDGKLLINETRDLAPSLTFDTHQLAPGTYIFRATSGQHNYTTKLIIK